MKDLRVNQECESETKVIKKTRNRLEWEPDEDKIIQEILLSDPRIHWVQLAEELNTRFHKKKCRSSKQVKARWQQVIKPALESPLNYGQQIQLENLVSKYKVCSRVLWWKLKEAFPNLKQKQIKAHVLASKEKINKKQKVVVEREQVQSAITLLCSELKNV